ncbi:MAG: hypothetical protein AMK72_15325 [Planctomycetes bacterium SM23_25]|nr:MAG: hypothetical protein AMS14_04405 [Planctomycetes bacterium DG_20]KPK41348.1 MAG: hypothetical protein AMK72_15325 [Planctomycetes bacterium SM23_25]
MRSLSFDDLWEKLCAGDESVEIEAKRGEQVGPSLLETVCAFSNEPGRGGGYILLGVSRSRDSLFADYEVIGVTKPDQTQAALASMCRDNFSIVVRPQITAEQHGDRTVLVAYIPEAQPHHKPVYIRKKGLPRGAFRRIGSTDQRCTEEDIALFYQLRGHKTFDETHIHDTAIDDFDRAALAKYREARAKVNPTAPELNYGDEELLYALAASARHDGRTCATVAGLMLFGTEASLRRHAPMARVDYIRVQGRDWVPDPEHRYEAVEMRGPLVTLIPRVVSQVLDDIPKAFSLRDGQLYRKDVPLIPRTVIREAVVNALMHRSYRQKQPVQVIRYANRIELRNPGHSLIPDDRLGEPGSLCRNEKIAAVLHEIGLAETKGTGIRAMREAMERANLTFPLFESDREKDSFAVTLLVHHFLGPDDIAWLEQFSDCQLSDEEAKALIVVREVGAINNAYYRNVNHVDTLTASARLRRLRDMGLLDQKGKGAGTYYVPTSRLTASKEAETPPEGEGGTPSHKALSGESGPLPGGLLPLPGNLTESVQALGRRASPERVQEVIRLLCRWRPLRASQIARILGRNQAYVSGSYLAPMVKNGILEYTLPHNPAHPEQAYRASKQR